MKPTTAMARRGDPIKAEDWNRLVKMNKRLRNITVTGDLESSKGAGGTVIMSTGATGSATGSGAVAGDPAVIVWEVTVI